MGNIRDALQNLLVHPPFLASFQTGRFANSIDAFSGRATNVNRGLFEGLWISYLATCDRLANSSVFIEVLISRQPMYRTSKATPSFMIAWSVWIQLRLFVNPISPPAASAPPPPPQPLPFLGMVLSDPIVRPADGHYVYSNQQQTNVLTIIWGGSSQSEAPKTQPEMISLFPNSFTTGIHYESRWWCCRGRSQLVVGHILGKPDHKKMNHMKRFVNFQKKTIMTDDLD